MFLEVLVTDVMVKFLEAMLIILEVMLPPEWSLWTSCSESCGPGSRQRTRRRGCDGDGDDGLCAGTEDVEREACQEKPCPGEFSLTVRGGKRKKTKTVPSP